MPSKPTDLPGDEDPVASVPDIANSGQDGPSIEDRIFGPSDVPEGGRSGFVALVGRPNVGKSTLLNALVGEKVAIVSPKPQTTRRRILGIRSEGGSQLVFLDTPGLHDPAPGLGRSMVRAATAALPAADVVVWVVDASRLPDAEDRRIARLLSRAERPLILAMNKVDQLRPRDIEAHSRAWIELAEPEAWLMTIATEGHNLDRLWLEMLARAPQGPPLYPVDQVSDQSDRMLAAELVREAALRYLQQEVPHGLEVVIESWKTREDGLVEVAAKIFVERTAHKAIVIGRGGTMIRRIGSAARRELERAIDARVFLELFVTVKPGWRSDPAELRRLGYE